MKWNFEVGPASIIGAVSGIIQVIVVVWVASSIYTGITNKIEQQGTKIEEVAKGSDKRFETVYQAIKETKANQADSVTRVSRVEVAIQYISEQIKSLQTRLDVPPGPTPPPPPPSPHL